MYPGTEIYERKKELGLEYVDDPWEKVEKILFPIPAVEIKYLTRYELSQLYLEAKAKLAYVKEC